jgi:hypothetical protein
VNVSAKADLTSVVTLAPGHPVAGVVTVAASGPDLPCDVELRAELERGTYVVTELRCTRRQGGPEVTGEVIRTVPVARILHAGALKANKLFGPHADPAALKAQGPTEESLRVVAQVYRMAHLVRDNPTQAVSSALGLPHSTAARWVVQARRAGFLGPAERRKAGESHITATAKVSGSGVKGPARKRGGGSK